MFNKIISIALILFNLSIRQHSVENSYKYASNEQFNLIDFSKLGDLPGVPEFSNVFARVLDQELKSRVHDPLIISVDDLPFGVHHAVQFHDADLKHERRQTSFRH